MNLKPNEDERYQPQIDKYDIQKKNDTQNLTWMKKEEADKEKTR